MVLLVAVFAGSMCALAQEPPAPVRLFGKVRSVEPGRGAFELEVKGGPYRVVRMPDDRLRALRAVTLRELRWSPIHVLGRLEAATSKPDGTKSADLITNVMALVAGQD